MFARYAIILAMLSTAFAFGADPVGPVKPVDPKPAAAVKVEVPLLTPAGKLVRVKITGLTADSIFVYDVTPDGAVDVDEHTDGLVLTGPEGSYKIKVRVIASNKVIATLTTSFAIGEPPPPPPEDAATTFKKAIAAAYKADTSADKAVSCAKLASLYRSSAKVTVKDPTVKTYGDLFADMDKVDNDIHAPAGVRAVIGAKIAKSMNSKAASIDRDLAAKEFNLIADALSVLK